MFAIITLLLWGASRGASALGSSRYGHLKSPHSPSQVGVDPAVFVSPYLPDHADTARAKAKVELAGWNKDLYSGFITIDEPSNSNMFFIFSEALDGNADAPILLWLQGGPGASSLFGFFTEIGPFDAKKDGTLLPRELSWNQHYHLLVIDNPVGTGYSFTDDASKFVTNQTTVGEDLYTTLSQFFQLFPNLRANDFYVTGESYAGKYVPACAYTIHTHNAILGPGDSRRINLAGIAIGDGAMDPQSQFQGFGELLFYLGMADQNERETMGAYEAKIQAYLAQGQVEPAFRVFDLMLNGDFYPFPTYYANITGMKTNYFNFEQGPDGSSLSAPTFIDFLATDAAKNAFHVGEYGFSVFNDTVESYLVDNWMVGVKDILVPLMENYKVNIYSGQNDIILGPPLTENFLRGLKWSGQAEYLQATKKIWSIPTKDGTDLAGYVREVGKFKQIVVRGAGHMVPGDQPLRGLDMITRFVDGKPF